MYMDIKHVVQNQEEIDFKEFLEELRNKNKKYKFMREIKKPEQEINGELNGIPFIAKDAICTKNLTSSAGSKILENYEPVFDATVIKRLKEAGACLAGKTHQDEFGFGTFNTNNPFTIPRNPHDTKRVVGGSSGGAAAAVAAMDQPLISLGESTGGSITNPAAYNGVIGITPTYGRVSRYGLIDYANSLDKIGVITNTIWGAAKGLEKIAGKDQNDHTTVEKNVPNYSENLAKEKPKIAVPKQYTELDKLDQRVKENFEDSIKKLKEEGAEIEKIDEPMISAEYTLPSYYVMAMAEASTNLAKMSGIRYGLEEDPENFEDFNEYFSKIRSKGFGEEAKRRILVGTYTRMAGYRNQYYLKAAKVRRKIIDKYKEIFKDYDIIASPSMPNIAPKREKVKQMDPNEIYAMDSLTVGPNLAGLPMISVPNGKVEGMPTGLHIIADHWEEQKILNTAYTYQKSLNKE